MKNMLSIEAFADWCEKQPADKAYDYLDPYNCACAQYAANLGLAYRVICPSETGSFWERAEWIAVPDDNFSTASFSDLAARLRAVQS